LTERLSLLGLSTNLDAFCDDLLPLCLLLVFDITAFFKGLFFTALNVNADEYLDENRLDLVFSSWSSAENCSFSNCAANSFPLKV